MVPYPAIPYVMLLRDATRQKSEGSREFLPDDAIRRVPRIGEYRLDVRARVADAGFVPARAEIPANS